MDAAPAVGALLMTIVLARHTINRHVGLRMFQAVIVFGAATNSITPPTPRLGPPEKARSGGTRVRPNSEAPSSMATKAPWRAAVKGSCFAEPWTKRSTAALADMNQSN